MKNGLQALSGMRRMAMRHSAAICACVAALGAASAVIAAPGAGVPSAPTTDDQLRAAIAEKLPELGPLEPWQKQVFEEEVIPHCQRFIKDYRPSANGLTVQIDLDHLKNYLKFYSPVLRRAALEAAKAGPGGARVPVETQYILVHLSADASCQKCADAEPAVKTMVAARLARRGFTPVWLGTEEVPLEVGERLTGKALDQQVLAIADSRHTAGSLTLQWKLDPPDDVDSAHADETRYSLHSLLEIKDMGRVEGHLELLDNDVFEVQAMRLLTDAFTDLGAKMDSVVASASGGSGVSPSDEMWVEVDGIRDYNHFKDVWTRLADDYLRRPKHSRARQARPSRPADPESDVSDGTSDADLGPPPPWEDPANPFELKQLARGKATFGIKTPRTMQELRVMFDGFLVSDSSANLLKLEAR